MIHCSTNFRSVFVASLDAATLPFAPAENPLGRRQRAAQVSRRGRSPAALDHVLRVGDPAGRPRRCSRSPGRGATTARQALSVSSQVAFAGSGSNGSTAPAGVAGTMSRDQRRSAAPTAAEPARTKPAQQPTFCTLPALCVVTRGESDQDSVRTSASADDRGDEQPVPPEDREVVAFQVPDHPLDRDRGAEERRDQPDDAA